MAKYTKEIKMSTKKNTYNKIICRGLTAQKKSKKLADLIEEGYRKDPSVYEKPLTKEYATTVQRAAAELSKVKSKSLVLENIELLYNRNIKAIVAATVTDEKKPSKKTVIPEYRKLEIKAALSRGVSIKKIQNLFPEFSTQSLNRLHKELKNEAKKMREMRTSKRTRRNGGRSKS